MVILPDHLHAMITLPNDDDDYATRWMLIKQGFSRQLPKIEQINKSRKTKGEHGECGIFGSGVIGSILFAIRMITKKHIDYIHYNPVKQGS